jgi:glycosyltransferase involved in cell wall biosynthesis
MAAGTFPVVSDIPANREWLSGEGDGLFFAHTDDDQLVAALTLAMQNEKLRAGAVERNRRIVKEGGDQETNMRILARHYERLVNTR